jgi:molybdate/tungstate transport system substrate-binding protein
VAWPVFWHVLYEKGDVMRVRLWFVMGLLLSACYPAPSSSKQVLTIFSATSLGSTLFDLARLFEASHPDVKVHIESATSRAACLKVTEQCLAADLVFVADADLIEEHLVPEVADTSLRFAQNALVLAYAPQCPLARLLHSGCAWQELLATGKYRVGTANPATSPVGYRALLALKLNDKTAPEHLRLGKRIAAKLNPEHRRNDVSRLVEPLQQHQLDAAFIYRSEALQHDLPFVSLNRRIDFSDPKLQDDYAQVSLTLPGSERTLFGSPALYSVAFMRRAPQPELAAAFVRLLLSPAGREVAKRHMIPLLAADALQLRGRQPTGTLNPLNGAPAPLGT